MAMTKAEKQSVGYWTERRDQAKRSITAAEKWKARALRAKARANGIITRRKKQLASAHTSIAKKAVLLAKADVGRVEIPDGSNWGPQISPYLIRWGFGPAAYCGAAVGTWLEKAGVKGLTSRVCYVPYIVEDSAKGVNGWKRQVWHRGQGFLHGVKFAKAGSTVCFDWGGDGLADHTAELASDWHGHGPLDTIEANTFPGNGGDQGAGNGVWHRTDRDPSLVLCIVEAKGI